MAAVTLATEVIVAAEGAIEFAEDVLAGQVPCKTFPSVK